MRNGINGATLRRQIWNICKHQSTYRFITPMYFQGKLFPAVVLTGINLYLNQASTHDIVLAMVDADI